MQFLMNALNPARVNKVMVLNEETRVVEVNVDDDQLSLAIGKRGQNVRLASQLMGWRIEVHSERERKEAAEREMRLLVLAPEVLGKLPYVTEDNTQVLIEAGVRTYEEFLETPPISIIEMLEITDAQFEEMEEAADKLDAERKEREAREAEEAAKRAAEEAAAGRGCRRRGRCRCPLRRLPRLQKRLPPRPPTARKPPMAPRPGTTPRPRTTRWSRTTRGYGRRDGRGRRRGYGRRDGRGRRRGYGRRDGRGRRRGHDEATAPASEAVEASDETSDAGASAAPAMSSDDEGESGEAEAGLGERDRRRR